MALATLNERAVSWSDIAFTLDIPGAPQMPVIDIKSLDFEGAVTRGEQRGASGGRVLKKTSGSLKNTCSATFYTSGLDEVIDAFSAIAPKDSAGRPQLSKVTFSMVVKHTFEGEDRIRTVKINGCNLDKIAEKHAEGDDAATIDSDLSPLEIVYVNRAGQDVVLL